jgi:RimJ/RimL family protein N-acetyltransferase
MPPVEIPPLRVKPVTLVRRDVRLEPLALEHSPALAEIGLEPAIWRYLLYGEVDSPEKMQAFIADLLERQAQGTDLPFVVVHLPSGRLAGCTRYMDIRNLEIGGTWYGLAYQRTSVNSEAKYLLLRHAFENLGVVRVQFKTDLLNVRSQVAIERLGAVREGVLRQHMLRPDGTLRSSVYYSILAAEWPGVKEHLEGFLAQSSSG